MNKKIYFLLWAMGHWIWIWPFEKMYFVLWANREP